MILVGDALEQLGELESKSVQTIITSPPYFGLRKYTDGDESEIGNENSPDAFVSKLLSVFMQCQRVLKDDGTFWLNIGDTMKGGQLLGVPWMLAFALKKRGWFLRSEIVWAKPNPMPESAKNRPTRSHEKLFLFTKQKSKYKFNQLKEEATYKGQMRGGSTNRYEQNKSGMDAKVYDTRNKRDVWTVKPATLSGAHFAIFPTELIAPCIEAGSDEGDTVLDPFAGSGTVGVVARKEGREFVGVELNPEFAQLCRDRISGAFNIQRPTKLQTWHTSYVFISEALGLENDEEIRAAHEHVMSILDQQRTEVFEYNDALEELLGSSGGRYRRLVAKAECPSEVPAFDELVDQAVSCELFVSLIQKGDPEQALFEVLKRGRKPVPRFEDAINQVFERTK